MIETFINQFQLQPHPEGGYFRETYRDSGVIPQEALGKEFSGARNYSTAIYFLLPEGQKSKLHRIKSDEVWHFYLGGPLTLIQISPAGEIQKITLGQNIKSGELLQHVVPKGFWFGATPNKGSAYSFVGCTVAPGFDFADFEMGEKEMLLKMFPHLKSGIEDWV